MPMRGWRQPSRCARARYSSPTAASAHVAAAARLCRSDRTPACANPRRGARCPDVPPRRHNTESNPIDSRRPWPQRRSRPTQRRPARVQSRCSSKLCEVPELLEAGVYIFTGESAEAIHAEFLNAEAAHDGAVDNGPADLLGIDVAGLKIHALFGQIADEAAREA